MTENKKSVFKSFAAIVTVQAVCVAVIIAGVFAVKQLSPQKYKKISAFFGDKMCEKTDINDVLKYFKNEI